MTDDFEERLRLALHREAGRLPFRIEVSTLEGRLAHRERRFSSWLLPIAAPILGALAVGALIVLLVLAPVPEPGGQGGSPAASASGTSAIESTAPTGSPAPTPAPAARDRPATAVDDGRLYMVGGSRGSPLRSAFVFDPGAGTWSRLPDVSEDRVGASLVALADGRLLLVGGRRDGVALDTTLVLDPGAEAWRIGTPLPRAQSHAAAARIEDRVFLLGGTEQGHERAVLVYDVGDDRWVEGAPMPVGLRRPTAVALDGSIYLLGGQTVDGEPSAMTYRYDLEADAWERLADMPMPSGVVGATAVQGRIWAFGDQHQALVFDPATNEWSDAARYARPGMSWYAPIAISSDRILVVSGSAGPAGAGADTILVGAESANGRTAVWISA